MILDPDLMNGIERKAEVLNDMIINECPRYEIDNMLGIHIDEIKRMCWDEQYNHTGYLSYYISLLHI
jgi:hypothetical protein